MPLEVNCGSNGLEMFHYVHDPALQEFMIIQLVHELSYRYLLS